MAKLVSTQVNTFFRKGFVTNESIEAANETQEFFKSGILWVYLFAQMQSGKTDTYLLIACEWIRNGKVDNAEIICGSSDLLLKEELTKKMLYFINTTYNHYMEDHLNMDRLDRDVMIEKLTKNVRIIWGTDLKKNTVMNPIKTLVIIEESHYGQSKNMMVDGFLKRAGICANGDYDMLHKHENYVISVSATGFSEISNMVHNNEFNKALVRLKPGHGYYGVKQMKERGKIKRFKDISKALEHACNKNYGRNGYALVRIKKNSNQAEVIARMHGYKVKYFDNEKRDPDKHISSLDELENAPSEPTIIFLKDKCRMGKEVPKQHILFCIETSKTSKTDTLLQALLGRMCGYLVHDIEIYIHESIMNSEEIDTYIEFSEGGNMIPSKATNLRPTGKKQNKKGGNPIIPIKIDAEHVNVGDIDKCREQIIDAVYSCYASGNITDHNPAEQSREISEKLKRLDRSALALHTIENKNKSTLSTPKRLFETFSKRIPGGPGTSMNVAAHGEQFSIMYMNQAYPKFNIEKGCVFIYTTTKCSGSNNMDDVIKKMPRTNKKEMFCRKPEEIS